MKYTSVVVVLLCCSLALLALLPLSSAAPSPSLGLLAKFKKAEIKYKLLPHLGFAKYNAVKYEPLRESPAAAPAAAPYPAEVPAGPYPPAL